MLACAHQEGEVLGQGLPGMSGLQGGMTASPYAALFMFVPWDDPDRANPWKDPAANVFPPTSGIVFPIDSLYGICRSTHARHLSMRVMPQKKGVQPIEGGG